MSNATKRPYNEAMQIAKHIKATLSPMCQRIEIAGSLRRQRPMVGDIELVAIPDCPVDLLGEADRKQNPLTLFLKERQVNIIRGRNIDAKYTQFMYGDWKVDLFMPQVDNWGWRFMLSTGSAEFNKWLVTSKAWGGAMPYGIKSQYGYLWQGEDGDRLETREESDVFRVLGLPFIPVGCRDAEQWVNVI